MDPNLTLALHYADMANGVVAFVVVQMIAFLFVYLEMPTLLLYALIHYQEYFWKTVIGLAPTYCVLLAVCFYFQWHHLKPPMGEVETVLPFVFRVAIVLATHIAIFKLYKNPDYQKLHKVLMEFRIKGGWN